ncbi:hypothetical protein FF2_003265 [Malus domestica]
MLYHKVQESKLYAVHCVNMVLQGPFFSKFDLATLTSNLDQKERQMMLIDDGSHAGDFFSEESHNVSLDNNFSIQEKSSGIWRRFVHLQYQVGYCATNRRQVEHGWSGE